MTFRSLAAGLVAALLALSASAAEVWEVPSFSLPAQELLRAGHAVKRERPAHVVVLLDERIFVLDEQHRLTRTSRLVYRVDSPDGVERWAASSARWQPWYQARPVIRARVVTADGREHLLDQKLLTEAGTRESGGQVYDDDHVLEGPLPAVEIGAVVEEEIAVRDEKPFFAAGSVFREFVGRPVPVMHSRIVIDAPESLPLKRLTQLLPNARVVETREHGRVRWTLDQGPLDEMREMASNLPADAPAWPSVEFSSGSSWEAVAANYREMTEPRIRDDDARPLLAGLRAPPPAGTVGSAHTPRPRAVGTSNAGGMIGANLGASLPRRPAPEAEARRDYIARVVQRLHREVRYTGVEFGAARLIPEFPSETLRRKFGDCKDKSTLLVAALRASGIDAYLALLAAGDDQDISPELPGLGMFDHAIVHIPAAIAGEPDLWIDATAEHARVGTLPAADSDRLALVIRAGEKTLTRTPAMRSGDNRQIETREFFLSEYGPSRVVETTETHGTVEAEYRAWYAGADTKARLDDLKTYARDAYRARELTRYEHTSSTDFSHPYSMTIEMKDAPIGFTDLETAAVGINVANITARLPDYFDERLDDAAPATPDTRTADVVFEPFVTEWRYRIQPPPGFQARKLPANNLVRIGPAKLLSEFSVTADGAVHATWRFDTVKGRYTVAETEALLKALRDLKGTETQLVAFDQIGIALRADGDFKGALQANEALAARHPRKAVHRLRSASALLDAGLGGRAQLEALEATRLEPRSALAWKTYGWTLQHDAIGRRFGAGFDRAGAISAYRKARLLEPANTDIAADLAVLLEHDARGVRYSPRANLVEAIAEYQARRKLLSDEDARSDDYANNLFYALLYAKRYPELREALRRQPPGATQRALLITAVAAEHGGAAGLAASRELLSSEADRRSALSSAGNILMRLREYQSAADFIEASVRGQTTTAANTQRIAMLRKTRRIDGAAVAATDPRGVVLRSFVALLASDAHDAAGFRALLSRRSVFSADVDRQFARVQRGIVQALAKQELPFEVGADLLFSNVRVNVEGDDAAGYRVQLRAAGEARSFFVVKEDGAYRLLTMAPMVGPLAIMALERVDAGDLPGARRWLDWARLELRAGDAEDPLDGPAFTRAWTVGVGADLGTARMAAAMLLADCALGERALPLLLAATASGNGAAEKLGLDLALAKVFLELQRWDELRTVAARLIEAVPTSALAFRYSQWSSIQLRRWEAVEAASRARLARLPDDSIAREMLVHLAEARGEFDRIPGIMQPLIDSGRATAADYNQYAWTALLAQPVSASAVDAARMAYDETQGRSFAIAHTLACVYAASGLPREARDLLLKGIEQLGTDAPDDSAWYGFGLVAEAYGDAASAREYYARVAKPGSGVIQASSVYALSQARLGALKR
jgi:transglutaminase-like putative cysteine protease/tetratricopeptide (TPR) repeat protein